jgi:hypothetical protein
MLIRLMPILALLSVGHLSAQTTLNASQDLVSRGAAMANLVPNQPALDAGPLLLAAIEFAKANSINRVIVDPGIYYFATLQYTDRHVNFYRANNMTLDLQGSELRFANVQRLGLVCDQCTNFTIQNFQMDFQQLPFTQVRVTAVDPTNRVLQYTVEPGWQDPSAFNTTRNPYGLYENIYVFLFRGGQPASDTSRLETRRPLGGGQMVLANNGGPWEDFTSLQKIRVGDTAVMAARASGEALLLSGCDGCTVRNGRIYSSGINAVRLIGARNTLVERVYVMPKPGTDRLVSSNADGVTLSQPRSNNVIRLSRAIRTMDDGFSPNSLVFGTVVGLASNRVVLVRRQFDLSISTGSPVTFQRRTDGVEMGTAVVTAQDPAPPSTPVFGETVTVTLDRDAPANVVGTVVYTTDPNQRGTGLVVERNTVQDQTFARGISLWGLMNSSVRGNYIWRSQMAAILGTHRLMSEDWMSPPMEGVTLGNNVVEGANTKFGTGILEKFAGIQILAQRQDFQPMLGSPHKNITIEKNFVADPSRSGIRVENTTGGAVASNRLVNPSNNPFMEGYWEDTFQPYLTEFLQPVVIKSSQGVTQSGTVVEVGASRAVVTDLLFQRLAAYGPGTTVRLNGWNVGGGTVTLEDADGVAWPVMVRKNTTHALDIQVPADTALGGAVVTVVIGERTLRGTLFVDGQDQIPAVNGCTYDAVPETAQAWGGSGLFQVLVVTQAGCPQLVQSFSSFVTVGAVGSGTGVVGLTFSANATAGRRTAMIEVNSWPLRVAQEANPTNVITFPQPIDTALTAGPLTLSATATSNLVVSYTSNTTVVCTVAGSSVTLVSVGTCSITANQPGNATFATATALTKAFNVLKSTQTITFPQPTDTTLTSGPVALTATATSGLVVGYTSNSTAVCSVSGSSVTLLALGTCSITANQSGNGSFLAATPVTRTFAVSQAAQAPVTFAVSDGNGFAGDTVELPIQLTSVGTPALSTFQLDMNFDPQKLTFKSARAGAQLTTSGKTISASAQPNGDIRLLAVGFNQNVIANGVVAYATFTLGSPFSAGAVTPKACTSADAQGSIIATACTAGTIRLPSCDINGDGATNVADVQLIINEALGVNPPIHDLNHDGAVNVADVQKVINAALGLGCSVQ